MTDEIPLPFTEARSASGTPTLEDIRAEHPDSPAWQAWWDDEAVRIREGAYRRIQRRAARLYRLRHPLKAWAGFILRDEEY